MTSMDADLDRGNPESLPRAFYVRDAREVARDLLGKELVHVTATGTVSGLIVETEAYLGIIDRASHAFGGRKSSRTAVMYEEGGRAYVYFIYGMYWCLNVTAGAAGVPEAVLVRALEPRIGVDLMWQRRNKVMGRNPVSLTNGPGKLCQAMAIDGRLYGADLCGFELFLREGITVPGDDIALSPRINIDYAGEAVSHEWRYFLRGNFFVSRG